MGEDSVTEYGGGLVDVQDLDLRALDGIGESVLAAALRRVLETDSGPVAGFQSAM
ncbi:FxSxx-COOH cyclophane-containing RiPP peptide [Nonomuraea sp. NPDC005983]|uniref:FxSxx-COOH cyclophane-containing RiPP peptide n=1 Tax=unclassified Nonomuraea TaxID=2593643 RepID=UPI0033328BD0